MDDSVGRRLPWHRVPDAPEADEPPPPDFAGTNVFAADPVLTGCLDPAIGESEEDELTAHGAYWGSEEAHEVARLANAFAPTLRRADPSGRRIDRLEIHPAYHALMNRSVHAGLASHAWEEGEGRHQHRVRAAKLFMTATCERGHVLALSATHAAIAALAYAPDLEGELFPLIASRRYDRRAVPLGEKDGAIVALALGEGTGPARTLSGEAIGGDDVRLKGSLFPVFAAGADVVVALARLSEGDTAVAISRYDDGAERLRIDELSQPLGLKSQSVATLTLDGVLAQRVGEPGQGGAVLRDVRTLTALEASLMASAIMRDVVARTAHEARHRPSGAAFSVGDRAFARLLVGMALTSAAATALSLRLAGAFDLAFERDGDHALARLVTPAAQLHILNAAARVSRLAADLCGARAALADHPLTRGLADLHALAGWAGSSARGLIDMGRLLERDEAVLPHALDEIAPDLGEAQAWRVDRLAELGTRAVEEPSLLPRFADEVCILTGAAALRRAVPRVVSDAWLMETAPEADRDGVLAGADPLTLLDHIVPEG